MTPRPSIDPARLESEWQARILGIVGTLIDSSVLTWAEFRAACLRLRAAGTGPVADQAPGSSDEVWADIEDWAPALRDLLAARGLLLPDQPITHLRASATEATTAQPAAHTIVIESLECNRVDREGERWTTS